MVVARGVTGDVGILSDHAPMLIQLAIHPLRIVLDDDTEEMVLVDGGFLNVTPGEEETRVDVLAENAEPAAEVDAAAARARVEALRGQEDESPEAEAELARATMRAEHGRG